MDAPLSQKTVLIVDDMPENIDILRRILGLNYRVKAARSGEKCLDLAQSQDPPDLILLDVKMPELDGYEVCRRLKSSAVSRRIPVIFVTVLNEIEDESKGFEVGAVDYITKPVSPPIVRARVKTHLALYDQNRVLEEKVRERTEEITHVMDVTIHGMAGLAETRDNETGNHIKRTQHYVRVLAEQLLSHERFRDELDQDVVELMYKSAPLHDIGKVGIRDAILTKTGVLTLEEFEEMKLHTIYGMETIARAEKNLGKYQSVSFLRIAREMTMTHHEKWDGSGYPLGLKSKDIPLSGRLMAIADVYDALISKRVYKPAMSHEQAVRIIIEGDGRTTPAHFDPDILEVFVGLAEKFRKIALEFSDSGQND